MPTFCGRLLRLIHSVVAVLKRLLCFLSPRRSRIGELPYSIDRGSISPQIYSDSMHSRQQQIASESGQWTDAGWGSSQSPELATKDRIQEYRQRVQREKERAKIIAHSDVSRFVIQIQILYFFVCGFIQLEFRPPAITRSI